MRRFVPIFLVVFLVGCAGLTVPETPAASLALAEITLEKVADELVFYRENGWIDDEDWFDTKEVVKWTNKVLDATHKALDANDEERALILLNSVNEGLRELQAHLRRKR